MPIFRIKSVKIYTGQKKLTRIYSWRSWQIWGMQEVWRIKDTASIFVREVWNWINLDSRSMSEPLSSFASGRLKVIHARSDCHLACSLVITTLALVFGLFSTWGRGTIWGQEVQNMLQCPASAKLWLHLLLPHLLTSPSQFCKHKCDQVQQHFEVWRGRRFLQWMLYIHCY